MSYLTADEARIKLTELPQKEYEAAVKRVLEIIFTKLDNYFTNNTEKLWKYRGIKYDTKVVRHVYPLADWDKVEREVANKLEALGYKSTSDFRKDISF